MSISVTFISFLLVSNLILNLSSLPLLYLTPFTVKTTSANDAGVVEVLDSRFKLETSSSVSFGLSLLM